MNLPNAEKAYVDIKKLEEYCLNPKHPRGKHKAKVFLSSLGITREDAGKLKQKIVNMVSQVECELSEKDQYGQRYIVDLVYQNENRIANIRTTWIIKSLEDFPGMVSCFIL